MKSLFTLFISLMLLQTMSGQAVITAVFDGPLSGGTPKGVEIYFTQDVPDLSLMGLSSANNGSGPTGTPEYTLPGGSVSMGQYIYISSDADNFMAFFGFPSDFVDAVNGSVFINGDDAIELFYDGTVIDVFGEVNADGTGMPWEHLDGWAARLPNTGPDGTTFMLFSWQFSGVNALDGETTNATAATPVPLKSYTGGMVTPDHVVTARNFEYIPNILVVDVGDIVQWDNIEGTHNVNGSLTTFPNNSEDFLSGAPALADWSYQYAFSNPGNNDYHCDIHFGVGMTGNVLVREMGDYYVDVENNFFSPANLVVEVGETVVWTNVTGIHNVNGSLNTYPNNPEGFDNGVAALNWTFAHTFTLAGIYNYQCDPHVGFGMTGTITVVSPYVPLPIATVRQNDLDGNSLYVDSLVELTGVVHGPNYRSSGLEFFLIDGNNDGIFVRTTASSPSYTVTEGDELTVSGVINQFNGLTRVEPDIILVNSTDNPILDPDVITAPSEDSEGSFIAIKNLTLLDTAQWPDNSSSANVLATNGVDTILMRIDSDIDFDVPVPLGAFDVTGLGGQFDGSSPYTSGYQILPRSGADIVEVSGTNSIESVGINRLYPNPTQASFHLEGDVTILEVNLYDLTGRLINRLKNNSSTMTIDMSNYSSGAYFVEARTTTGVGVSRIIKE